MKKTLSLILAALMALALVPAFAEEPAAEPATIYAVGDVVEDFSLVTADGSTFTLSEALETYDAVVINFWYDGCSWCEYEFPYLEEAYGEYKDKIGLIAVSPYDENDHITEYMENLGLTFPAAYDTAGLNEAFACDGYPTTVVIDRFGVLCYYEAGAQSSAGAFERLFDAFLAEDYTESLLDFVIPAPEPDEEMPDAASMAAALNAEGAEFAYTASTEENPWPWLIGTEGDRTYAYSSNDGVDGTVAYVDTVVTAQAGEALVFDYKVKSEFGCDYLVLSINGEAQKVYSGDVDWTQGVYAFPEDGEYAVSFAYMNTFGESSMDDVAMVDNVQLISADEAAAILAEMPQYPLTLEGHASAIDILTEGAREVVITDETGNLEDLYRADAFYIIPGDTAEFRMRLGADCDVNAAYSSSYYDGLMNLAATCETDEEGFLFSTVIDSMETSGYSWGCVYVVPRFMDLENDVTTIVFFASEEDLNYFCQNEVYDPDYQPVSGVTWMYADGTAPTTDALPDAGAEAGAEYTLSFKDQDGNPVPGVIANICDDASCTPMTSDEDGIVTFVGMAFPYAIHIIKVPDGYEFDMSQEFTAPEAGGDMEFEITKK